MDTVEITRRTLMTSSTTRIMAACGSVGIALSALVVRNFDPTTAGFFPTCALYTLTGFYCPGCGLTRGFHALFNGDVLSAIDFNLLLPFFAFFFGYATLSLVLLAIRGRGLSFRIFPKTLLWTFLGLSVAFGIVRNLPYYPFTFLAP